MKDLPTKIGVGLAVVVMVMLPALDLLDIF